MRRTLPSFAALTLACLLTACGGDSGTAASASTTVTPAAPTPTASTPAAIAPSADTASATPTGGSTPAKPATPRPKPPTRPALTCAQLADAQLGSAAAPYNGYPDHIPLTAGVWNGEDGATVELQKPCATGDLDGDGAADAVGTVRLRAGGTGQFWTVVVWRNSGGEPAYQALLDLGDRTPVTSVSVSGQRATVVWLTRSDGRSMAELDIRRTSVYRLSGTTLVEVGHTDAPYTP
ncbi:hypothetical protein [Micromonospora halophytica]|uniref:Lipoprotein n=1 Tax=Micromonospora halophytica TaxID=47864 RepID=A0A1C5ITP5_9ACTN|nr:hypothetical protein [Micromonospora halophytica]SCG61714.1 hypothetical protein GA0070560_11694 [Micromonospora halophytica]